MASIYRRKSGIYYVKFKQGGRWHYRSLSTKNRRQADKEKTEIERRLAARVETSAPRKDITFAALKIRYLEWAAGHRRPQTIESRERALERFPLLTGVETVARVQPDHVEAFKRRYLEGAEPLRKAVGPRTVNEALGALRAVVNRAQRQKWYTGPNPFAQVEMLPEPKRRPAWLAKEQIESVLEAAELHGRNAHLFFAQCLYAGMRKDEALNARWEWYDLGKGLIHIAEGHGWTPKTGNRTLPLHSRLREILREYGPPANGQGYLIAPEKAWGKNRYRFEIRRTFDAVAVAAGLSELTPHVLRHTFASQLAMAGVSLWKISQFLGHTTMRTTQIYAHLRPEGDEDIERF
ncbi:MAG TPA: site-specific integrase [Candidatus Hydrogenedentes bacterium]|jgi:integrase|nr:site-specific integrase [Candidatus Hydrogenedentota bacterium]